MSMLKTSSGDVKFSQKILYPGCHIIDRKVAYENLKDISLSFSDKLKWGVAFGTLLGIVRDGNFIEWDEDVDLYILEEEEEKFKNLLPSILKKGFELIRFERGGLYSISRNGEYTDFYVLKKVSNDIRYTLDGCFIFEKYLKNQKALLFKDIELNIPKEIDEYLTLEYGDWRTPVRYYPPKTGVIKKCYLLIYYYFRIYSPDCIYYWWIKKRRNKDLQVFLSKCAKKGYFLPSDLRIK